MIHHDGMLAAFVEKKANFKNSKPNKYAEILMSRPGPLKNTEDAGEGQWREMSLDSCLGTDGESLTEYKEQRHRQAVLKGWANHTKGFPQTGKLPALPHHTRKSTGAQV